MTALPPGAQGLRLRHPPAPTPSDPAATPAVPKRKRDRHSGLLQDQLRRSARGPWCPSFSGAVRLLLLVRVSAAMYSNITDCDEVYNFWEPLHLLFRGYGFQTWELSPAYAIRSWAYILLHLPPAYLPSILRVFSKRSAFFSVRIALALLCSLSEASFYRTVVEEMNYHLGRYVLLFLLFSAGMWSASAAFLPSSFAMYTTMIACASAFRPASSSDAVRTLRTTLAFAAGAVLGWPFAIALAVPFVFEELFVYSGDKVPADKWRSWAWSRLTRLVGCGVLAANFLIVVGWLDTLAYGRLAITPWNIISYNLFTPGRGPDLYGTSPWHFYILNLSLAFNLVLPLALLSLPALLITSLIDRRRIGLSSAGTKSGESSPVTMLALRLAPMYLWIGILSAQPHKEERFMFPAYPLVCFNAATTLYLARGWLEVIFVKLTKSPYRASKSPIFALFTYTVIFITSVLSLSRIAALYTYYHAPLQLTQHFEHTELPRLLIATHLLEPPAAATSNYSRSEPDAPDLSPVKAFDLSLCLGKEWYRFPSHFNVPDGVRVEFIKSAFDGLLPRHFDVSSEHDLPGWSGLAWKWGATRAVPADLNDLNQEELSRYVPVDSCDYLIDLDFPLRLAPPSPLEPRYAQDSEWERVLCVPFLDAEESSRLTRVLWVPGSWWDRGNRWGEYCLLRAKGRAKVREAKDWRV